MFKKIYIEITNNCNLDCNFCIKNKRSKKFMTLDEYSKVLENIKPYTKYVYLHLMGEPLLHPKINEIIDMTSDIAINVNITTNGYLIDRVVSNKNIRQINVSLHSFDDKYKINLDDYLNKVFDACEILNNNGTIINYRLWVNSKYYQEIINKLKEKYNTKIKFNHNGNFTLKDNIFVSKKEEFTWPTLNSNEEGGSIGTCLALKDHIGILSNLDVVACCLDSNGDISFGNLNDISLSDILSSKKFLKLKNEFEHNIKSEKLCQNCNFYK